MSYKNQNATAINSHYLVLLQYQIFSKNKALGFIVFKAQRTNVANVCGGNNPNHKQGTASLYWI